MDPFDDHNHECNHEDDDDDDDDDWRSHVDKAAKQLIWGEEEKEKKQKTKQSKNKKIKKKVFLTFNDNGGKEGEEKWDEKREGG